MRMAFLRRRRLARKCLLRARGIGIMRHLMFFDGSSSREHSFKGAECNLPIWKSKVWNYANSVCTAAERQSAGTTRRQLQGPAFRKP